MSDAITNLKVVLNNFVLLCILRKDSVFMTLGKLFLHSGKLLKTMNTKEKNHVLDIRKGE